MGRSFLRYGEMVRQGSRRSCKAKFRVQIPVTPQENVYGEEKENF